MFEIDGYRVFFRHDGPIDPGDPPYYNPYCSTGHAKAVTECCIFKGDEPVTSGFAYCSFSDNYERSEGRRVALTDALKHAKFTREQRTKFWQAYWLKLGADWLQSQHSLRAQIVGQFYDEVIERADHDDQTRDALDEVFAEWSVAEHYHG